MDSARREMREARAHRQRLTVEQAHGLAILAFAVMAVQTLSHLMYLSKASTLQPSDLASYHHITPWMGLAAQVGLVFAAHAKGVRYWLVYGMAAVAIVTQVIWILLLNGGLQPSDLEWLNQGPAWWKGQH